MNRHTKRGIFYVLMTLQILWWIKVVFTDETAPTKPHGPDIQPEVRDIGDLNQVELRKNNFNTLNFHIQNVRKSSQFKDKTLKVDIQRVKQSSPQFKDELNENATSVSKEEVFRKYYNALVRHTILPRNFSFVMYGTYLKNPSRVCRRHEELDLLIIVHTKPYHFSRRATIRQTLANNQLISPYTVQPVFFIGITPEPKRDSLKEVLIEEEFRDHGDLVQMAFDEDFRNLSLKAVLWLKWTNDHCQNALMILKIDDDVILDIFRVVPLSRGLFSKYKRSIFCNVNKMGSQPIPRIGRTKVDPREFMDVLRYPYTYCSGFIVFFTPDLLPLLVQTLQQVPFYNVDDVFMFGMVPKFTGHVTYHNLGYNVSIWYKKVYNCTIEHGKECPYFGTMAEKPADQERVWQAMARSHGRDFHFPQIKLP